ncbi:MAG: DUF488 domain-containing protein [Desulfobacteraceae bacterium]|nr:DUF488 domain-containing protein [Desulfobacteraceae bacterium]
MLLYTIGYEGLDQQQFLAHLTHNGVDLVADVRKLPVSRKKGFSKTSLKEMLNDKNIEYLNFQALGAPKEMRDELYASGDYERFFKKYQDGLSDKTEPLQIINELINSGKKVSLLCFERNPGQCHRNVVAEEIQKIDGNGLKVKHIVPL